MKALMNITIGQILRSIAFVLGMVIIPAYITAYLVAWEGDGWWKEHDRVLWVCMGFCLVWNAMQLLVVGLCVLMELHLL